MIRKVKLSIALFCFAFFANLLADNSIKQIRSNSLTDKVQIVIDVENKPQFNVFVLSNPIRLVVDIKGVVAANYQNKLAFKNRGVTKIRTGNRLDNEIRLVLDLNHDYNWEVYDLPPAGKYGNRIVIDVFDYKNKPKSTVAEKTNQSANSSQKPIVLESLAANSESVVVDDKPTISLSSTEDSGVKVTKKKTNPQKKNKKQKKKTVAAVSAKTKKTSKSTKVISKATTVAAKSVKNKKTNSVKRKKTKSRDIVVIIDPGHGGKDSGALGGSGTKEKVVVLQIAKKLKRKIDKMPGMRAVLTRKSDRYISLRGRLRLARKYKGDLFVSVHADAFTKSSARGASVFILSNRGASSEAARWLAKRENAVDLKYGVDIGDYSRDVSNVLVKMQQDAAIEASNILANKTLQRLKGIGKVHKRHVERAGFAVLKSPDIPSMLVETAFISNPEEEKRLKSPAYQDKLAAAIAQGIKRYFDVHLPHHLLLMDAP